MTSPDVVQVLSSDRKTAYAMMTTIPVTRPASEVSRETEIVFKETAADLPHAIEAWFPDNTMTLSLPGSVVLRSGIELIYSEQFVHGEQ